jgi:uncharacterized protein DUF3108
MMTGLGRLAAVVGAVFLSLGSPALPAATDDPIATRFEVFGFAGMRVLTLHSKTEETADRYAVSVEFATKGMASVFVDLTTRAQVRGRITANSVQPEMFRNDSRRNGAERHNRVDYRPDGLVDGTSTPPPPDPIPPATVRGSVDNLTAYFRLERQVAHTGSCALTVRVFDGRHGYDLVFSDAGRTTLSPAGGQNFAGETIACRMARREWPGIADTEKDEGARSGTIWYAKLVPGDLLVPVRMQMDTHLGVVDGFLAELHGRGVNRTFME